MIYSPDNKFLPVVPALIFLLTAALPGPVLSGESRPGEQNVLRQASLEWMQVGIKQYQSRQFEDAELSFRRALVFRKFLTDDERNRVSSYLENARIAAAKAKQSAATAGPANKSVKQPQPPKVPAKSEKPAQNRSAQEPARRQIQKGPDKTKSPPSQMVPAPKHASPTEPELQLAGEAPGDIVVLKDKSFKSQLLRVSDWLAANRANILMVGLPLLAVLIAIAKFQARKRKPGTRVYMNPALAGSSFIGANLSTGRESRKKHKDPHRHRPVPAAEAAPSQKGFTQSLEHWRKHAINAPAATKPFDTNESHPQRKDKFETAAEPAAEAEKKQCGKCKKVKPVTEFYKNKSTSDGLARWCKECKKQYRREHKAHGAD
jgi:hypothetical protein